MDWQILSNGTVPYEAGRASSFDYYTYCTEAYLVTALFAKNLNYSVNLFNYVSPNGGSIKKIIDLLIKYSVTKELTMLGSTLIPSTLVYFYLL